MREGVLEGPLVGVVEDVLGSVVGQIQHPDHLGSVASEMIDEQRRVAHEHQEQSKEAQQCCLKMATCFFQ